MTREEALNFFNGAVDEDELQDLYEEQLFDFKQFFLSKAPISKLFEGRIRKMVKLGEAYRLLVDTTTGQREKKAESVSSLSFDHQKETTQILGYYLNFQKQKNEIRRMISNAGSSEELVQLVEALVGLEKLNAEVWYTELESEENIIVSKEPDPMYLLEGIKTYRQRQGETFAQLKKMENNPPEILIQEMKRLSLLFKKF